MSTRRSPLGIIFLTIFVSMVGFGIVIPVLPLYAKSAPFKMTPDQLGWLTGIFSLFQLVSAPIIGKISDRIGRKPVLLVSIIGTAIGYFVTGSATAAWMLFAGRIIDGISGGNIATAQACIADVTPPNERSKAMGIIGAAFGLGFILGPAIGGYLAKWGAGVPFYFAGALSVLNVIFVITSLPETLSEAARQHPERNAPLSEVFTGSRGTFIGLLLGTSLVFTTGFGAIHVLFSLFCADRFHWGARGSSLAFAYVGFIAVLVQGGLIRRLLKYPIEKEITVAGCALLGLSLFLLPRTETVTGFLLVTALLALGNGLATPTLTGLASRHIHGRAQGRVLGLMAAAGSLGRFLGPALSTKPLPSNFSELARPLEGGALVAVNQGYITAFNFAAGLLVLATLLSLLLRVPKEELPVEEEGLAVPAV